MTEEEIGFFDETATTFKQAFDAFFRAGFNKEQSFELTKILFTHALTRSAQTDVLKYAEGLFR